MKKDIKIKDYDVLFNSSLFSMVYFFADGKILRANDEFSNLIGLHKRTETNIFSLFKSKVLKQEINDWDYKKESLQIKEILEYKKEEYYCYLKIFLDVSQKGVFFLILENEEYFKNIKNDQSKLAELNALSSKNYDVVYSLDLDGTMRYVSPSAKRVFGVNPEDIVGQPFKDFIGCKRMYLIDKALETVKKGKEINNGEFKSYDASGQTRYLEINLFPYYEKRKVKYIQGIARDITKRKEAELALQREKDFLRITFSSVQDAIISLDKEGNILLMNKMAEDLFDYELSQVKGRFYKILYSKKNEKTKSLENLQKEFLEKKNFLTEKDLYEKVFNRKGNEIILLKKVSPLVNQRNELTGYVVLFSNITSELALREEVIDSERIRSLKILASGLVHDYNNILTAMMGALSLISLFQGKDEERVNMALAKIETAVNRAVDLTQHFSSFLKGNSDLNKKENLVAFIKDVANSAIQNEDIFLHYDLADSIENIQADPDLFYSLIFNLLRNAEKSMPEGGKITIKTDNCKINSSTDLPLNPGVYAKISVIDSGNGYSQEEVDQMFDTFYLSKMFYTHVELANSYIIAKKHFGYIDLKSKKNHGTTVSVYLPQS